MKIAVIGTGKIGGTLGRAFARGGHEVTFGSRRPDSSDAAGDAGATVADIAGALRDAEVVTIAVPSGAVDEFLADHADKLAGRLVIDATNRVGGPGPAHSAAQIAAAAPTARYVRAFNTLGWENFDNPVFDGVPADLFFSAPTADRSTVEELISAVGLRPVYVGEGQQDVVDGVLWLWFALAIGQRRGRNLAFRVLER
jgi:predicted dinucleotide-binding enzyme